MTKPIEIESIIQPDRLACSISDSWVSWDAAKSEAVGLWREIQEFVFATSTKHTSAGKLPWSNSTTIPKLCQIRDNLHANYMAAMFPKRKWMEWQGDTDGDEDGNKKTAIEYYMGWVVDRNHWYDTCSRLVYDYIDYGNVFTMPEWYDGTSKQGEKKGYIGPRAKRISPLDICFDPTAASFEESPKIIRSIVSLGEVKDLLLGASITDPEERKANEELYNYLKDIRQQFTGTSASLAEKDRYYNIAGYDSFKWYMASDSVEVLTFYGDVYDSENDTLLKNQIIKVVDRHKLISKTTNPTYFGHAPIYHCGWRLRPDNLWAQGPLDNLVGMQYRIDHLENMKADVFDLTAYPPVKIKGSVEEFSWGPLERIYVGDDGDVALMSPDVNALQADNQIAILEAKMEEMAGAPKEAMGFRTPGEKTKYEVQSMENAASRIFMNKIAYFERHIIENLLNAMLELARRSAEKFIIRGINDEFKSVSFREITPEDLTGMGRIKPFAARHFAEQSQMVQNLTSFYNSAAGSDPEVKAHFSSIKLAKLWEYLLELEEHEIVQPFIRLSEQADGQRLANSHQEQTVMQTMTPNGFSPGDFDQDVLNTMDQAPTDQGSAGPVPTIPGQ